LEPTFAATLYRRGATHDLSEFLSNRRLPGLVVNQLQLIDE
jgi:hypothetical protein